MVYGDYGSDFPLDTEYGYVSLTYRDDFPFAPSSIGQAATLQDCTRDGFHIEYLMKGLCCERKGMKETGVVWNSSCGKSFVNSEQHLDAFFHDPV